MSLVMKVGDKLLIDDMQADGQIRTLGKMKEKVSIIRCNGFIACGGLVGWSSSLPILREAMITDVANISSLKVPKRGTEFLYRNSEGKWLFGDEFGYFEIGDENYYIGYGRPHMITLEALGSKVVTAGIIEALALEHYLANVWSVEWDRDRTSIRITRIITAEKISEAIIRRYSKSRGNHSAYRIDVNSKENDIIKAGFRTSTSGFEKD